MKESPSNMHVVAWDNKYSLDIENGSIIVLRF